MKPLSNSLIALVLSVWAVGTCFSFWHFEGQYMRPVARPVGASVPLLLPRSPCPILAAESGAVDLTGQQPVTVLNFWNPRCPCSRYAENDVRQLISKYSPAGVRFVTIIANGAPDEDEAKAYSLWAAREIFGTIPVADSKNRIAMKFGVWAAPSAVILDSQSRIEYVGAYNAARYCSNPDTAWAAKALAAVVHGQRPPKSKTLFFGCQLCSDAG